MVAQHNDLKQQLIEALEALPEEALGEVALFLDYQRYKFEQQPSGTTPYRPVSLGGLWKDKHINDADIADVRREMWGRFADHVP
jgi:hypothetical protein